MVEIIVEVQKSFNDIQGFGVENYLVVIDLPYQETQGFNEINPRVFVLKRRLLGYFLSIIYLLQHNYLNAVTYIVTLVGKPFAPPRL